MNTFNIATGLVSKAEEIIAKANRKAEKAGIAERVVMTDRRDYDYTAIDHSTGLDIVERRSEIQVEIPELRIAGWTFAATLTWDVEAGLITRSIPGAVFTRPTSCECEVCRQDRNRTATFVVVHTDGSQKQVGRNCLERFLGIEPKGLFLLEFQDELGALVEETDDDFRSRRSPVRYPVVDMLALTIAIVQTHGWVSRSAAVEQEKVATANRIVDFICGSKPSADRTAIITTLRTEETRRAAEALKVAAMHTEGQTDYAINLRAVAAADTVDLKNLPLLASAYAMEANRKARQAVKQTGVHVGAVGAKITVDAKIVTTSFIDGQYGVSTLIIFQTADGSTLKWFASGRHVYEDNTQVKVTATVKSHGEWKGIKETMITRAKVVVA